MVIQKSDHHQNPLRRSAWAAILAITSVLVVTTGCNLNFTISDGYSFNYQGVTTTLEDGGEIPTTIQTIKIDNRFGNVDVDVVTTDATPNWSWTGTIWAPTESLAEVFTKELVVEVGLNDATQSLTLIMPERNSNLNGVESNFTIAVPTNMVVQVTNRHGDVDADGLGNQLQANVGFGDLRTQSCSQLDVDISHGNALLKTSVGDANVEASFSSVVILDIQGKLKVDGSHSSISASNVTGNVDVESSFEEIALTGITGDAKLKNAHGNINAVIRGNVKLDNRHGATKVICHGTEVTGESSHGDMDVTVTNAQFGKIDLETSFDDLTLRLPGDSNPQINMKTKFGETKSSIPSKESSNQKVTLKNSHGDIFVRSNK